MESLWLQICDIQGRLFKLAWKAGYDSEDFMKQFMRSRVARDLDSEYNRMQWAGEEYLLEEFADECPRTIKGNAQYDKEVMYWAGYLYRYWHILTIKQGNLCAGSGKDHEHQLFDVPHHGSRAGN